MRLFESQTYDFEWWIVIQWKRTCPLTSGVRFLESCYLEILLHSSVFRSPMLRPAISAVFLTCLCRSQNSFVFLIWWIVSEMEFEKSRIILHIRRKNFLLATISHTKFHYIYEILKTCLLLLNHLEMRSQKSWELVTPSS